MCVCAKLHPPTQATRHHWTSSSLPLLVSLSPSQSHKWYRLSLAHTHTHTHRYIWQGESIPSDSETETWDEWRKKRNLYVTYLLISFLLLLFPLLLLIALPLLSLSLSLSSNLLSLIHFCPSQGKEVACSLSLTHSLSAFVTSALLSFSFTFSSLTYLLFLYLSCLLCISSSSSSLFSASLSTSFSLILHKQIHFFAVSLSGTIASSHFFCATFFLSFSSYSSFFLLIRSLEQVILPSKSTLSPSAEDFLPFFVSFFSSSSCFQVTRPFASSLYSLSTCNL